MTALDGPPSGRPVESIKVQGITINPGDDVLVLIGTRWVRRIFAEPAWEGGAWMEIEYYTANPDMLPGPFPPDRLRHPSLLDGIIREIDAGE